VGDAPSPLPPSQCSQLLEDLYAVWECLDQAWGHTGDNTAVRVDGWSVPGRAQDERVCTVCVLGAIDRMLGDGDGAEGAIRDAAPPGASRVTCALTDPLGAWSERSSKSTVMRAVAKAIAAEEERCRRG